MRRLIILLIVLVAIIAAWVAYTYAAQNMTANSTTYDISGTTVYANLINSAMIPQTNGTIAYCNNCTPTAVCSAGGTGAFALMLGGSWNCATGDLADIASYVGPVNITGNQANGSDQINKVNINGTVNPLTYAGADIGAQINAAIAGNPGGTEIIIPPGHYSQVTTIQCPITPNGFPSYIIRGAGASADGEATTGTILGYTGGSDAINQVVTNTANQNSEGCQLRDLTLDGTPAGVTAVGFHFGGTLHSATHNVTIQGFQKAGIEIENEPSMFTERYDLNGTLWRNGVGIYFHCDAGCNSSFEHAKIYEFLNVLEQGSTAQDGFLIDGVDGGSSGSGALLSNIDITLNGNMEGTGVTSTGVLPGGLIHISNNALVDNNTMALNLECDISTAPNCMRFKMVGPNNNAFAGQLTSGLLTSYNWFDYVTNGAIFRPYGWSVNNNATIFNASVNGEISAAVWGVKGDAIWSQDGTHASDGVTSIAPATFTSASAGFTPSMVGDAIFVNGAGASGATYSGTIATIINSSNITVTPPFSANLTGAIWVIGYDNTYNMQGWLNTLRNTTTSGINNQATTPTVSGYLPAGVYLHRGLNFGGSVGVKITGAGMNISSGGNTAGGSSFLCVMPTTSPTGCHDFTGAGDYKVKDIAFFNGTNATPNFSGVWNMLLARHPAAGFAISNTFENVTWHSMGTYNVINSNSEQNSWINDTFNDNGSISIGLYITTGTSLTLSPWYGPLTGAAISCTLNRFSGGATQFSANSHPAVVIDGTPDDLTFRDAYVRLNQPTDNFISDASNNSVVSNLSFSDLRVEPDTSAAVSPTNHFINFTHTGSGWNGGEMHNISIAWPSGVTPVAPIINIIGNILAVHFSGIDVAPLMNPIVTIGGVANDDYFGNINAQWITVAGTPISPVAANIHMFTSPVGSWGNSSDVPEYSSTNSAAGANTWTMYNSGTGTGAPWGAGGMGWNNSTGALSAGGFDSTGNFKEAKSIYAQTFEGSGTPTASGAGITTGSGVTATSNSFAGSISVPGAGTVIFTPGFTCPGSTLVTGVVFNYVGGVPNTVAHTATTYQFTSTGAANFGYTGMTCG